MLWKKALLPRVGAVWLTLLATGSTVLVPATQVLAQAEVRQDGVQLKVRRLPDAIELVLQDAGIGGALEQQRQGKQWVGELRTNRTRGLKAGPQSLAMPDAGMERITFDGTGRLFQLKVTPLPNGTVPPPIISSDGKDLVVRFPAPALPIAQTAKANLSRPTAVPTPAYVPALRPRAVAPPVGDMAVGTMTLANRGRINISGPPVTLTTRGANARDVLMVLAQMGGYGFAFQEEEDTIVNQATSSFQTGSGISNDQTRTERSTGEPRKLLPITVSFKNENYEQAFNFVLAVSGLQARLINRSILVGPSILKLNIGNTVSKVYRLNQVGPNAAADYLANLGARVTKTDTIKTAITTGSSEKDAVQGAPAAATTEEGSQTFVQEYGASSGPLLGLRATTDTRLGTITLVGEPGAISIAEQYLKQLDLRQRQVALSVKILDVTLNNDSEIDNSFAFRFGNNFIVNDGGRLLAAFGRNLPPGQAEFERPLATEELSSSSSSSSFSDNFSSSSEGQSGSSSKSTVFSFTKGNDVSDSAVDDVITALQKSGAKVQSKSQATTDGVTKVDITVLEDLSETASQDILTSRTKTYSDIISRLTGQDVVTEQLEFYDKGKTASSLSDSLKTSGSSIKTSRKRNPALNYPDQEFFDFLQAQIISSNTKVLASPTLILQEGDSPYVGSDDKRLSEDGKVGRSRTNEALVRVGTQLVTSYSIKQDINGNNFCEPVFGNAGLTFGARVDKIDDNGFVTFALSPEISAAVGSQSVGNCGTINLINDRLLDSGKVRVRDGQTLILTGVISDTDQQVVSKWPILGDLPLVGQFFRRSSGNRTKNELVIMVTPRIIDDEQGGAYGYGYQPSTNDARRLMYGTSMR